jgi:CheY-like chemotaxis protein
VANPINSPAAVTRRDVRLVPNAAATGRAHAARPDPSWAADLPGLPPTRAKPEERGSAALIVVVDDRNTNRLIFSRLAASIKAGAVVEAFSDPLKMLAWIEGNAPDLVITDYKMPGMDGAEFIRQLRALPQGADATDFLQSPVDHQEFVTRGRNLLNLGQQQKLIRGRAEDLERELQRSEQSRETAIRHSRTRLIQVIDTIPALISAVDEEGRRVFVNRYGAALLAPGPQDGSPTLDGIDAQVLSSGLPVEGYEEEVIDRHGQPRTFLTSKFPLQTEAGAPSTVLTTSFDISERKLAEQALRHLAEPATAARRAERRAGPGGAERPQLCAAFS